MGIQESEAGEMDSYRQQPISGIDSGRGVIASQNVQTTMLAQNSTERGIMSKEEEHQLRMQQRHMM